MNTPAHDIRALQRRSIGEAASLARRVDQERQFSLIEIINAKIQFPQKSVNRAAVDAGWTLSEACRQYSGVQPLGQWVPFAALSRDLDTTSGASALAPSVYKDVGAGLGQASTLIGAGASVLTGLQGSSLGLPIIDDATDTTGSAWIDEGATAPQREPTFGSVTMAPKTLSIEMAVSRALLRDSGGAIDAALRAEILRRFALEIDRAAIAGAGSATEPAGILTTADVPVVAAGTNGAAPTWAHILELEYQASIASGLQTMRAPLFVGSPKLQKKLRGTQRASGEGFILESDALLGKPFKVSTAVPDNLSKGTSTGVCSGLIFGDASELFVGFWGPAAVDILIDGHTQGHRGMVRIIARAEVGIAVRTPGAFAVYKDLLTA